MEDQDALKVAGPLVDALLHGIERRFDHFFKQDYFPIAAAIHPKFKLSWLTTSEADQKLKKRIVAKLETLMKNLSSSEKEPDQASTPVDPKDFFPA